MSHIPASPYSPIETDLCYLELSVQDKRAYVQESILFTCTESAQIKGSMEIHIGLKEKPKE